jgi:hypothetical protein
MKKIIIDIDTITGDFTVDILGHHGKACKRIMDEFLESSTTKTERLKREYADRETEHEVQKAR